MCKNPLNTFVKILIVAGMIGGLAALVLTVVKWIPEAIRDFVPMGTASMSLIASGVLVGLCILLCEFIGWKLLRMIRTLSGDPFVVENVRALRQMGVAALVVMALGLSTLFFSGVPLAVVGALPVGVCGLFSLVLAQVFEKAVAFKQENDLTV